MADKYIRNNAGVLTEKEATVVSAGAGDAGEIVALDSTGRIDLTVLPVGIGPDVYEIAASENLAAGDFVNVWNDGGTAKARKADATTDGKQAHGYVLDSVTSGADATVYFEGSNTQVSGATPGPVFLATSAGGFTATAPSASGNVVQRLGVAVSATVINFERTLHYVLA
jgi:hypothetical protein